ncbi:MAG TPA: hypothetical protein VI455_05725 [Terriglobia bacterium]
MEACIVYAHQAARYSPNAGDDTVHFIGWICARYGFVESKSGAAYGDDLQSGRVIRPRESFLRGLCRQNAWNAAKNVLSERRKTEQLPPIPPELAELFGPGPINPRTGRRIWKAEFQNFRKEHKEIKSEQELARRLGVSYYILSSIAAGRERHGDNTAKEVLKKIGIEIPD